MPLRDCERYASLRVGVLELHGDFAEHNAMLRSCGVGSTIPVRQLEHLEKGLDALVLPGGESTVMGKLLGDLGMMERVRSLANDGLPMLGTCAGCILLAKDILGYPDQPRIGALDIVVERNAYGSQIDSFEATVLPTAEFSIESEPLRVVHIRAPGIARVGNSVRILAEHDGAPILVRQGNMIASTFHPEMTTDQRIHAMFLEVAKRRRDKLSRTCAT